MRIVIASTKPWNINDAVEFQKNNKEGIETYLITEKEDLLYDRIKGINPEYIFFPHWSWIIPIKIFQEFPCIVFHMTDLPFGRGGSPLQNLIERGIKETKISALKVEEGIDTGPVYLKKDLNLDGTAEEIFIRASEIIFSEMIPEIINNNIVPKEQTGEVVEFKRRKPGQSEIMPEFNMQKIYDYIRMLDCEGYPKAFIKLGKYTLNFSKAELKNGKITANVEITDGGTDE